MPDSDTILIIWFKLLALAGKSNSGGFVMISDNIPYTIDMLETLFRRKKTVIALALKTFEQFGMIEINDNDTILIANWDRHQNVKGLDKIREQNRIRQQRHREKQKQLEIGMEEETPKKKVDIPFEEIVEYLNQKLDTHYRYSTPKTKELIKARFNEGFTLNDFYKVIDNKCNEWYKTDMAKYLRPQTLFGTKFESYLNQSTKPQSNRSFDDL